MSHSIGVGLHPLRVLALTPYPIVPTVSGGRLRTFHLLTQLMRRGHIVTNWVIAPDEGPMDWDGTPAPIAIRRFAALERIGLRRKVAALVSPFHEGAWACPPPSPLDLRGFDVALLFHGSVGRFAVPLRAAGVPVIYCAENVEHELARRLARLAPTWASRMRLRVDAIKLPRYEARLVRNAQLTTTVSERDAVLLRRLVPDCRIEVLPSGADIRGVAFVDHRQNRGDVLILVGTLGYLPNHDAAVWLADQILPMVRRRRPGTTVRLVGSSPPTTLEALRGQGIELVGRVADVQPELARADLFVAPLRAGSGVRLKVLEAFAAGIPVVATTVAAEGLEVENGVHLAIADDADAMSDAICSLLDDPDRRWRMAIAARRLVEDRYDWKTIGGTLEGHLREVTGQWAPSSATQAQRA